MKTLKVLVVDDSAFMRKLISDIIEYQPDLKVIGTARNGEDALKMIHALKPDVVTLDVEMPVVDGISALKEIMETTPLPVIMLSSLTQKGAELTLKALELGAVDFVAKPSGSISLDIDKVKDELTRKIRIAALTRPRLRSSLPLPLVSDNRLEKKLWPRPRLSSPSLRRLVLIGTSTGGPRALHQIIPQLPGNTDAGVLIVQHMPAGFTKSLAERLDSISALAVKEAEHGEQVLPGTVYIAPGNFHLKLNADASARRLLINLTSEPPVSGHRPSVDAMFESVAGTGFAGRVVGVILTGMGQDGSRGVVAIKEKGAGVIAEDAATCVVFGMPKMAIQTGTVDKVVTLPNIAREIVKML